MAKNIEVLFNVIDPEAIELFGGRRVVFIVPGKNEDDIFIPGMESTKNFHFPERTRRVHQQRAFVKNEILNLPDKDIVVITESLYILSDTFPCQTVVRNENNGFSWARIPLFGASLDRIAVHLLDEPESIGEFSDDTMESWLNNENLTKEELNWILLNIGGGWPRAKLRDILNERFEKI